MRRFWLALAACWIVPASSSARAADDVDYDTPRYEPAAFPLLGGDSDVGFQLGAVATLTRFERGVRPYLWNMDLLFSASVKNGPDGLEMAQQNHLWQWDIPELAGGRLRITPLFGYQRTVNQGYFGIGNASSGAVPAGGDPQRRFQWIHVEARARQLVRIRVSGPWDVMLAPTFRYVDPSTYPGSKLAADARDVLGVRTLSQGSFGAGVVYDTRDNEIFPHRGQFHQAGLKYAQGFPLGAGVRYGGASSIFAGYVPLARDVVLAMRAVVDLEFGNVPFYDLFAGGPFQTYELPGGSSGVRGVPIGRYLGPIKMVTNAELRALPVAFTLGGQRFRIGGDAFVDTGRVWSDYSFASPLDGSGLGLKYGVGGGAYLLWGQAAIFRLEVAYSPDAASQNPSLPLGIYVEDGVMF